VLKHANGGVELSPIYDFAPMFLDPDLIKRRTHWRSEPPSGGIPDWNDVCDSLSHRVPHEELASRLRAFGERLRDAPAQMRDLGIDDEIVQRRTEPIRDVAVGLCAVREV
jgi:serine/threonine-protein kinase HipA